MISQNAVRAYALYATGIFLGALFLGMAIAIAKGAVGIEGKHTAVVVIFSILSPFAFAVFTMLGEKYRNPPSY